MEVKEMVEDADLEISASSQVDENASKNLKMSNSEKNISAPDFSLNNSKWLATVDNVKTKILLLNEEIIIPELVLQV